VAVFQVNNKCKGSVIIHSESDRNRQKGSGWHEYRRMHPYKKKLMGKETYIAPVDGMAAFIGFGFWT
jgi:signal transduction histidine kinase